MMPPSPWMGSRITAAVSSVTGFLQRSRITEFHMGKAVEQRFERLAIKLTSCSSQTAHCLAVKSILRCHELAALSSQPCHLQTAFNGFRAAVDKEACIAARQE